MNKEATQTQNIKQETKQAEAPPVVKQPAPTPDISEGFNLIPAMSQEEKVIEKTKSTVSIGSVISLIVLVVISLVIVGFNILSKEILNSRNKQLFAAENRVNQQIDKLSANEDIVDRAVLYNNVKKGAFSHRKIIEFFSRMGTKIGDINIKSVMISEQLQFTYAGSTSSLENLSKLWYVLGIDENIETINLQSVSKNPNGVNFTFDGKLNGKSFYNQQ
ncbi:MAG: hypothetical protein ACOX0X_02780 [Candidatus Dojkabacteria bacterium]